ncbi:MAG: hypothetical protein V1863_03255 [Candidatus Omnitrophota bacterium]
MKKDKRKRQTAVADVSVGEKKGHWAADLLGSIAILSATSFLCYFRLIARNAYGNLTHLVKWDVVDFTYPMLVYISDCFKSFIFPLWNPYQYSGAPFALNPGTALYNPICFIVSFLKGYNLELLQVHTFLIFLFAGLCMYFCLKSFMLSKTASLVGAVSFMSCGFFVAGAEYFTIIHMMAFLPVCLMLVNRVLERLDLRSLGLGALALALMAFFGHPTILVSFVYFLFLFGLLKIFFVDAPAPRQVVVRKVFFLFGFFTLGLLSAAILLVPGAEFAALSSRSGGISLEKIKIDSLPFPHLANMWYPFLALMDFPSATLDIALRNCSIGILGLFFALRYLLFNRARLKWAFLALLSTSLLMSFGDILPSYKFIVGVIPFIKHFRHPAVDYRAVFLFVSCLCAAFGVQDLLCCERKSSRRDLTVYAVFLATALLMYGYIKFNYRVDIWTLAVQNYPFLLVSFFSLLLLVLFVPRMPKRWLAVALVAFCVIDVSHWAKVNFLTIADPVDNAVWASIKQAESFRNPRLDDHAAWARRAGRYPLSLQDNYAMVYKYFSDTGYDPLILRWYDGIMRSPARKILTEDFRVLPVTQTQLFPDEESVLSAIQQGADLHKTALLNVQDITDAELREKLKDLSSQGKSDFSARIIHHTPNSVIYELKTAVPAVVFFNEIYYPGWRLFSEGSRLPLFKMNLAFRGTYLEAGSYQLKMTFLPLSFKIGLAISVLCLLFVFVMIFRPHGDQSPHM